MAEKLMTDGSMALQEILWYVQSSKLHCNHGHQHQ